MAVKMIALVAVLFSAPLAMTLAAALTGCTSPADQFIKAYPHRCVRINDQWIDKDGTQTSRLEEFPCKISGDTLPAIAK